MLKRIEIPELISERAVKLEKKYGLSAELAREIVEIGAFEDFVKKFQKVEPAFIAHTLVNSPKEIRKRYGIECADVADADFSELLGYLNEAKVSKDAVFEMLVEKAKGNKVDVSKYKRASMGDIESEIKKIVKDNPGASPNALMGEVMKKFRGKVDGKKVMELLKAFSD